MVRVAPFFDSRCNMVFGKTLAFGLWLRFVRGKSRGLSSAGILGVYVDLTILP